MIQFSHYPWLRQSLAVLSIILEGINKEPEEWSLVLKELTWSIHWTEQGSEYSKARLAISDSSQYHNLILGPRCYISAQYSLQVTLDMVSEPSRYRTLGISHNYLVTLSPVKLVATRRNGDEWDLQWPVKSAGLIGSNSTLRETGLPCRCGVADGGILAGRRMLVKPLGLEERE